MPEVPTKVNAKLAEAYFRTDYQIVTQNGLPSIYGWEFDPSFDALLLNVKIWALDENGNKMDDFYMKLDMSYYNTWPPGVTFVNPETRAFEPTRDLRWFPKLVSAPQGTQFGFSPSTRLTDGSVRQLVCNSMVLEYYMSSHNPSPQERWDPNRNNFGTTLSTIQLVLKKPYYGGRWA
jgi:hypothetical protein